MKGEEITLNYREWHTLTREERRNNLKDNFNFHCCCQACSISREEVEVEAARVREYRLLEREVREARERLAGAREKCQGLAREVHCLQLMYKLATELGVFTVQNILYNIVEEGYNSACRGFKLADRLHSSLREDDCPELGQLDPLDFLTAAGQFASLGAELAGRVLGQEGREGRQWRGRREGCSMAILQMTVEQ